jgi:hypothetical protein
VSGSAEDWLVAGPLLALFVLGVAAQARSHLPSLFRAVQSRSDFSGRLAEGQPGAAGGLVDE